jgi:hypothetical protein
MAKCKLSHATHEFLKKAVTSAKANAGASMAYVNWQQFSYLADRDANLRVRAACTRWAAHTPLVSPPPTHTHTSFGEDGVFLHWAAAASVALGAGCR